MGNKITMQDIANNLGLSKSLVSRALSDSYSVSENTKALIRNEASRIGYTAKPYKKRAANSNGILLLAPSSSLVDHSFYYQIFNDIENECAARGMRLMVCATENFYLPSKNDIAGVIVFANAPPDTLKALLAVGIPVVLVDFNYQMLLDDFIMAFDHVSSECNNSIYLLVKHLHTCGHRRIGFVGHYPFARSFYLRYCAFINAADAFGVDVCPITGYPPPETASSFIGEHINAAYLPDRTDPKLILNPQQLLDAMRADNPPTALFCMNDIAATQVYQLLHASGYSIPDDVSVAGFDNIKIGRYLSPPLTTIDIPKKAMGQEAVKLLLTRAENPNEYTKTVYVSTEVVLRDSVKKLLL